MRALQITAGKGAPQGWAQEAMFLATWSVFLQLLLCLALPLCLGRDVETDEDGNVKTHGAHGFGLYVLESFRYLCMVSMYGGAVLCVTAVFEMDPQTADGSGQ